MITRHYKRIVKDILQRGGAKYDAYAVTASNGRPYYTAQEQPNYSADQTAMSMSTDQPGVIIGSGTAAESETSYWLAQQITSGFTGSVLPTHEMVDGTHALCLYVTIANTGNSSITISEIGYALITPLMRRPSDSQFIGSPYPIEKNVLIDRTVLASPITIAAGNSVRLKYALKTTDELFSGSVVLIPKTVSANGVYNASSDNADGYSEVTVSVTPNLQSKTVTENGTVTPDQGYDGLSSVLVNVSGGLPSAYKNLIEEASIMFGHQVFDGTAGYCIRNTSVPSAAPIPTGRTACSVEAYFNCTASGYIIGFGNMATRQVFSFTPEIFVSYGDDHGFSNSYTGENHLVVVYDGGTTVYIYANGSLAETFQLSRTITIGGGYFFQGQWAATSQSLFQGTIYHTAVWKRALTPTEVATLYQNRNSISESDQI